MKPIFVWLLISGFCLLACTLQAAERVALVMGNSHYQKLPALENCAQDARLMMETFQKLGIRVAGGKPLTDLTADQMDKAINEFVGSIGPDTEAFLYFSGHGVQVDGLNYLLPVDFRAEYQSQVKRQAISLDDVLTLLEGSRAKLRVIILDSCRDAGQFLTGEPASKGLGRAKGLAEQKVDAPETLVCFATKHGTPAFSANDAAYSFYTGILAEEMLKPGRIEDVLRAVARRVYEKTEKQQLPFTYGSLLNDHFFMQGAGQPVIATVPAPTVPVMPTSVVPTIEPTGSAALTRPLNLPPSGYFDLQDLFASGPYANYNPYSRRQILKRLQQKLQEAGFYSANVDGDVGPKTQLALEAWQRRNGGTVSGHIDEGTVGPLGLSKIAESAPPHSRPAPKKASASNEAAPTVRTNTTTTPSQRHSAIWDYIPPNQR